ncbi:MAG TPA: enoyl-CoA hydratase-related protein [Prolixibacteraceae bacterium]|nr:enoyl-CoA hydratase-related protein [Prolixibacteraceae bacterium]
MDDNNKNTVIFTPPLGGGGVSIVNFNRPSVHNALNPSLMRKVIRFLKRAENDASVRVIVLRGNGPSFCAGADLAWMKKSAKLSEKENLEEARLLSEFFAAVKQSSKVTIAVAHGNVFGGGNGLVAVCDLAYGLNDTRFSLSETRLGIVAATISPFMLQRLPVHIYKELVFTARKFDGLEAEKIGLLNKSFETTEALDAYLDKTINAILNGGPLAVEGSKRLIDNLCDREKAPEITEQIPKILAEVRVSSEAREGFAAFLEKRKPNW